jgi:dienelactone hydrolase
MGGQFALVMSPKGFGASAPFYGTPLPRRLSETLDGACPIVASFGRRDPLGVGAPARLRKVVDDKGIAADIKVYPDAGHSFANKLPGQPLSPSGAAQIGVGFGRPSLVNVVSKMYLDLATSANVSATTQAAFSSMVTLFFIPPRSFEKTLNVLPSSP